MCKAPCGYMGEKASLPRSWAFLPVRDTERPRLSVCSAREAWAGLGTAAEGHLLHDAGSSLATHRFTSERHVTTLKTG